MQRRFTNWTVKALGLLSLALLVAGVIIAMGGE